MKTIPRFKLALVREGEVEYGGSHAFRPREAAVVGHTLIGNSATERMLVMACNTRLRILGVSEIANGEPNECTVSLGSMFKHALLLNATGIVLMHNHPSGSPHWSPQDMALTKRAKEVGKELGIKVLDHIIVGPEGPEQYCSMAEQGALMD